MRRAAGSTPHSPSPVAKCPQAVVYIYHTPVAAGEVSTKADDVNLLFTLVPQPPTADVNKPKQQHHQLADLLMTIGWLNVKSLTNKIDAVNCTITDLSLDAFAQSQTWHSGCDDARLRLATPPGYVRRRRCRIVRKVARWCSRHHLSSALKELSMYRCLHLPRLKQSMSD